MPILDSDDYRPKWFYRNGHLSTILPYLRRKESFKFKRERINTPDGDFLDLDFHQNNSNKIAILCHGLEGSSDSLYIKGMAKILAQENWDILAWNYRSCSGEINRNLRIYHSGATDDLEFVINQIETNYENIAIVGFSLGGNLALKYAGENSHNISSKVKAVVGISAPVHLSSSSAQFKKKSNYLYTKRFFDTLFDKVKQKHQQYPDEVDLSLLTKIKTLWDFDNLYTGPIHGFDGAEDYYAKCSALQFLSQIRTPTLLINAEDDPFLSQECMPYEIAKESEFFHFLSHKCGGHVWFGGSEDGKYWSETRTLNFLESVL